ncbi:TlpA family protein disulfide reductase [Zhouia spongiae]|uniref:TlpA family protein disulfide reductase n=1 Tax=Zhouia spongiae TaxID=2202721 RepID=A0ABY3YN51_9FLAO|nr:TlpA disulfide reductase family protein [Zhouia spongiae]UNY99040.1 TlpA family protein disulfide reductase [Zhouia spongiae]
MRKIVLFALLVTGVSLAVSAQSERFGEEALNDVFETLDGREVTFESVLNKHAGKTVFIDVWATWCKDCRVAIPEIKALQEKYGAKEVSFVFLSLDREKEAWKTGVKEYDLSGDHYFITRGWKESPFCQDIKLDWIPRYMIVNPNGKIEVFRSIKTDDQTLIKTLKVTK